MSYYENAQWPAGQAQHQPNNWEQQRTATPVRTGASAPQPQDDYAFSYQFDEVDRAHENLQKSGKGYAMSGRRRTPHGQGSRSHSVNNFDEPRGPPGPNLQNFYAQQRHHQPSRGSNDAEQQYQRTVLADPAGNTQNNTSSPAPSTNASNNSKHMSEEETRELIARQRSALYGEGPFADKTSYVDESGNIRKGAPGPSGASSLRGASPMTFDGIGRPPADAGTPTSAKDHGSGQNELSPRPNSTTSPQSSGPNNKVFDNAVGAQSRTSTSSPTGASPPRDLAPGSKPGQQGGASVAPIGTRPAGTPTSGAQAKRSTTPLATSGGWGRGNGVWGQASSGLGAQASVWG
ncbi:hypothetical protein LMH87_011020 [Akanthomyces muscarius]|uniref:Uncharacterized protein n=1 Tax=Akanthomyces muscarius TaxID=2231603 RepID=A0A9W8UJK2_AKAMU|nr:hypothetical protein LMH87_011020 [Akanthomyces muscarius]KAJ4150262.1 hypothetical protein LMH87_011020 [Akanthomyces muscarius]